MSLDQIGIPPATVACGARHFELGVIATVLATIVPAALRPLKKMWKTQSGAPADHGAAGSESPVRTSPASAEGEHKLRLVVICHTASEATQPFGRTLGPTHSEDMRCLTGG